MLAKVSCSSKALGASWAGKATDCMITLNISLQTLLNVIQIHSALRCRSEGRRVVKHP